MDEFGFSFSPETEAAANGAVEDLGCLFPSENEVAANGVAEDMGLFSLSEVEVAANRGAGDLGFLSAPESEIVEIGTMALGQCSDFTNRVLAHASVHLDPAKHLRRVPLMQEPTRGAPLELALDRVVRGKLSNSRRDALPSTTPERSTRRGLWLMLVVLAFLGAVYVSLMRS